MGRAKEDAAMYLECVYYIYIYWVYHGISLCHFLTRLQIDLIYLLASGDTKSTHLWDAGVAC